MEATQTKPIATSIHGIITQNEMPIDSDKFITHLEDNNLCGDGGFHDTNKGTSITLMFSKEQEDFTKKDLDKFFAKHDYTFVGERWEESLRPLSEV